MRLLIYCPDDEEKVVRILGAVRRAVKSPIFRLCHSIDHLSAALGNFENNWDVFLALISTPEDLRELHGLGSLIRDQRMILILADRGDQMIKMTLGLCPSYFTDYSKGLEEVTKVLSHLAEKPDLTEHTKLT